MLAVVVVYYFSGDAVHGTQRARDTQSHHARYTDGRAQRVREIQRYKTEEHHEETDAPYRDEMQLFRDESPHQYSHDRYSEHRGENYGRFGAAETERVFYVEGQRLRNERERRRIKCARKSVYPEFRIFKKIYYASYKVRFLFAYAIVFLVTADETVHQYRQREHSVNYRRIVVSYFFSDHRRERYAYSHRHELRYLPYGISFGAIGIVFEELREKRAVICVHQRVQRSGEQIGEQHVHVKLRLIALYGRGHVEEKEETYHHQRRSYEEPRAPSAPFSVGAVGQEAVYRIVYHVHERIDEQNRRIQFHIQSELQNVESRRERLEHVDRDRRAEHADTVTERGSSFGFFNLRGFVCHSALLSEINGIGQSGHATAFFDKKICENDIFRRSFGVQITARVSCHGAFAFVGYEEYVLRAESARFYT